MSIILERNNFNGLRVSRRKDLNDPSALLVLQNVLSSAIESNGIQFSSIKKIKTNKKNNIYLRYHRRTKNDNEYCLKKSYLPDYYYLDKNGYSGWAEICNNPNILKIIDSVSDQDAIEFYDKFSNDYLPKRISKIKQEESDFKVNTPFVFVPMQVRHDSVMKLARIKTVKLANYCIKAFANTEYKVVIKPHPRAKKAINRVEGTDMSHVVITDASIHDIIPKAAAVYVVNSGVGFESLLYLKKVFSSGGSDYSYAANEISTYEDILNSISSIKDEYDVTKIKKYLYYMLKFYFLNVNDAENVSRHIKKIIQRI